MLCSHWSFCWTSGCSSSSGWAKLWLSSHSCAFNFCSVSWTYASVLHLTEVRVGVTSWKQGRILWRNFYFFFLKEELEFIFLQLGAQKSSGSRTPSSGWRVAVEKERTRSTDWTAEARERESTGRCSTGKGQVTLPHFSCFLYFIIILSGRLHLLCINKCLLA